jgi:ribosomal protein L40E
MDDSSKTETKWCMKCHEELKLDSEECRLCGGETFYHFKPEQEVPSEATIDPPTTDGVCDPPGPSK